jgi:hypothetical protein
VSSPQLLAFTPTGGRLQCSAFSTAFKVLAVLLVSPAVVWGWQMWSNGTIEPTLQSSGWLAAALAVMLYTLWHILNGTTTLDAERLEQSWVWHKRVQLRELAYVKLIRVRGLEWLMAPRLYTKTFSGKLAIFYAASPPMLAEFERLEAELRALRARR